MSASMERRYQQMIDLYPRSWRQEHGSAMIGTLLDAAEGEGRDRPTTAECLNLAVHAGFARLAMIMPEQVRQGVAAVGLATGTAFAMTYLMFAGWAPFLHDREFLYSTSSFGPFINTGVVLCAAWIVAFTLALFGWRRAASVTLVTTVVIAGVILVASHTVQEGNGPASRNVGFLVLFAALALLGNPTSRPRLALSTSAWLFTFIGLYASNGMLRADGDRFFWYRIATPTNIVLALVFAAIVAIVLATMRHPRAAIVVLWSCVPWLAAAWLGFALDDAGTAVLLVVAASVVGAICIVAGYALRRAGVSVRIVHNSP